MTHPDWTTQQTDLVQAVELLLFLNSSGESDAEHWNNGVLEPFTLSDLSCSKKNRHHEE